jgi:hypothetical protein
VARNFNFLLGAKYGFLERQFEAVAQIFAAPRSRALPRSRAKKLTEDVAENIFEAGGEIKSASKRAAVTESSVAELVVLCPLFPIAENLISFGNFFKGLFGFFVPGIAIRVVF